mmetsp:Transcript_69055/g.131677  ORF Transcript_69055/g.131677 Transcript_69055/m.131677 type:complete len:296 (+) Transcript_69055:796-1683(+)
MAGDGFAAICSTAGGPSLFLIVAFTLCTKVSMVFFNSEDKAGTGTPREGGPLATSAAGCRVTDLPLSGDPRSAGVAPAAASNDGACASLETILVLADGALVTLPAVDKAVGVWLPTVVATAVAADCRMLRSFTSHLSASNLAASGALSRTTRCISDSTASSRATRGDASLAALRASASTASTRPATTPNSLMQRRTSPSKDRRSGKFVTACRSSLSMPSSLPARPSIRGGRLADFRDSASRLCSSASVRAATEAVRRHSASRTCKFALTLAMSTRKACTSAAMLADAMEDNSSVP